MALAGEMEQDFRNYWIFRAKNTLEQLSLHLRRRQRMIAAFAFYKFRH